MNCSTENYNLNGTRAVCWGSLLYWATPYIKPSNKDFSNGRKYETKDKYFSMSANGDNVRIMKSTVNLKNVYVHFSHHDAYKNGPKRMRRI